MQNQMVHEYNPAVAAVPGPTSNPMSEGTNMAGGIGSGKPKIAPVMSDQIAGKSCIGGDGHGGKC